MNSKAFNLGLLGAWFLFAYVAGNIKVLHRQSKLGRGGRAIGRLTLLLLRLGFEPNTIFT